MRFAHLTARGCEARPQVALGARAFRTMACLAVACSFGCGSTSPSPEAGDAGGSVTGTPDGSGETMNPADAHGGSLVDGSVGASSSGSSGGSGSGSGSGGSGSGGSGGSSGAAGSSGSSGGTGAKGMDAGTDAAGGDAADGASGIDASAGDGGTAPSLAATPPMGWNNFNHFVDSFTATTFMQAADAMVSSGLHTAGYQYINIDDSWDLTARDASGNLVPDPAKFPNGIKAVADYVHGKGLKLGIYADRGVMTCSKFPGSFGFEARDAALFASWGVDYVKVDNCYPNTGTSAATSRTQLGGTVDGITPDAVYQAAQEQDYKNWSSAIKAAGRPMVFSICAWWFYGWEPTIGSMFRTTKDIKADWLSFLATLDGNGGDTSRYADADYPPPGIAQFAGPGHWNDPDMLEVDNTVAGGGMTIVEQQSEFSLWSVMAAPLILGNDLTNMSAATLAVIGNREVIAVDQDALGKQGTPISTSTTLEVWSKPLSGVNAYAVALFNRTASAANITVTWSSLGIASGTATVRDLWAKQDLGSMAAQYTTSVASHAVVLLKVVGQ